MLELSSLLQQATAHRESGEFSLAIDVLKERVSDFSTDASFLALLAHCYILNDEVENATVFLEKAKEADPKNALVGWNEARLMLKNKSYTEALVVAKKTHGIFPNDIEGMGILGACLKANSEIEESLIYLNKAISLDANYSEALINRGLIKLSQGDKLGALSDLEQAHNLKPYIRKIWDLILSLKLQLEQFSEAVSFTVEIIKIDPADEENYIRLVALNHKLNNPDIAIKSFEDALNIRPNSLSILVNLGLAFRQKGQFTEAMSSFNKALEIQSDCAEAFYCKAKLLTDTDDLDAAIGNYERVVEIKPDSAGAWFNLGNVLQTKGRLKESLKAYQHALRIKPDYADAFHNMGNANLAMGNLDSAIESYQKVLDIDPDHSGAYCNLGSILRTQGNLDGAIVKFNEALKRRPDFTEALNNKGLALNQKGDLVAAIESYKQVIKIEPDNASVYYNMGIALDEFGDLENAIDSYKQALEIRPEYPKAAWNLSGTAKNIKEAKGWLELCLDLKGDHLMAMIYLAALKFYEGDKSDFNNLIQSSLNQNPWVRSCKWAFDLPNLPELYFNRWSFFDGVVERSSTTRPFYEFGVWRGIAFGYLIKTFKSGYGFDTFEGLPEDWHQEKEGKYSSDGNIPKIDGGEFIKGKFEDTLPKFFSEPRPLASVINFDADLYSSTITALNFSKPVVDSKTILIFDEFLINPKWEQDEYRALNEFCENNNYTYDVLAISFFTKQVAVRLIGI